MAEIAPYQPVLLFVGILFREEEVVNEAFRIMDEEFPPFDLKSETIPFGYSNYYDTEMGSGIKRCWVASGELRDPSKLAKWKLFTDGIERRLSIDGRRQINLDPGFVGLSKVVLASLKDHPQRVPLESGVYAEFELIFNNNKWDDLPWTYRDYADKPAKNFLTEVRSQLYHRLKNSGLL